MSTTSNIGSQVIRFAFKQSAEGGGFNETFYEVIEPGIYYGGSMSVNAGSNTVDITEFVAAIQSDTDKTTLGRTRETVQYSPSGGWPSAPPSTTQEHVIYLLFDWIDAIQNWMSFNSAILPATLPSRAVTLGVAVVDDTGTLVSVSETSRTEGLSKDFLTNQFTDNVGTLSNLLTVNKDDTVVAINELTTYLNQIEKTLYSNIIVNGDLQIDQENGGSITGVTDGIYTADMFRLNRAGTFDIDYNLVDETINSESWKALKLEITSENSSPGTTDFLSISSLIEGTRYADIENGEDVFLSFWVNSSEIGTYALTWQNFDGTRSYISEYTVDSANTWERKVIPITTDTGGTWKTDTDLGLYIRFILGVGTALQGTGDSWLTTTGFQDEIATSNQKGWFSAAGATFMISQVRLLKGDYTTDDTPFRRRPQPDALIECQRYKWVEIGNGTATNGVPIAQSFRNNGTDISFYRNLPIEMRIAPTGSISGTQNTDWDVLDMAGNIEASGTMTSDAISQNRIGLNLNGSYTSGESCTLMLKTTTGKLFAKAEY